MSPGLSRALREPVAPGTRPVTGDPAIGEPVAEAGRPPRVATVSARTVPSFSSTFPSTAASVSPSSPGAVTTP